MLIIVWFTCHLWWKNNIFQWIADVAWMLGDCSHRGTRPIYPCLFGWLVHCLMKSSVCAQSLSHVLLSVILRTVAFQTPLSMEFFRQAYWCGLPFPPPGDLPNLGFKPTSPASPAFAGWFFTAEPSGKPDEVQIADLISIQANEFQGLELVPNLVT